jgi:hypothetical protein
MIATSLALFVRSLHPTTGPVGLPSQAHLRRSKSVFDISSVRPLSQGAERDVRVSKQKVTNQQQILPQSVPEGKFRAWHNSGIIQVS